MMSYQFLHGRRLDGDVDGVQVSFLNLLDPLDVHIQDADNILGNHVLYC